MAGIDAIWTVSSKRQPERFIALTVEILIIRSCLAVSCIKMSGLDAALTSCMKLYPGPLLPGPLAGPLVGPLANAKPPVPLSDCEGPAVPATRGANTGAAEGPCMLPWTAAAAAAALSAPALRFTV